MRDYKTKNYRHQRSSKSRGNPFSFFSLWKNKQNIQEDLKYLPDILLLLLPFQPFIQSYLKNNILVALYILGVFLYFQKKDQLTSQPSLALIAGLAAFFSPILPWYHHCVTSPGVYECTTWNGFEYDNSSYGFFVFLAGLAVVLKIVLNKRTSFKIPLSLQQVTLISGMTVLTLGFMRWFTFNGTSSEVSTIGSNLGLYFLLCSSIGLLLASNYQLLTTIIDSFKKQTSTIIDKAQAKRLEQRKEAKKQEEALTRQTQDEELDEILQEAPEEEVA